ncbi:hypothetical protein PMZ80_001945 [Knufia obscura]|uniref:Uncharacterized protein n=2 Tax=Knufia TaxID=430999 RepID=A0AAN8EEJ5_9EURO|nr:hypothetical protein PMZ80_001945 [Knufia obscura]KAK5953763.1 hypothetical protein OHC33_005032 [Knufia fluminis]
MSQRKLTSMGFTTRTKKDTKPRDESTSRPVSAPRSTDETRGRTTHRQEDPKQPTRTPSRSANITRQSSRRPRREAQRSISPIRAVYHANQRNDLYRGGRIFTGRVRGHVSQGEWYERSPHLRDGRAHSVDRKPPKSPSLKDEGEEDKLVRRMVEARAKMKGRKERTL